MYFEESATTDKKVGTTECDRVGVETCVQGPELFIDEHFQVVR